MPEDPDLQETRLAGDVPPHPASTPSEARFAVGDLLSGRFRIIRFIARGGMGELYEADDLELHERVALKTMRPETAADEDANRRFRREVHLARQVTHPNICRIFDLFQHQPPGGEPAVVFVTMELVAGETLSGRLSREGRISPEAALPLVAQMAAALAAAHQMGIVHRDFKSSNVMLLNSKSPAEPPRVVITDFGIAYRAGDATAFATRSAGMELLGTPDFMAPEQLQGGEVTAATDIYALGIVMHEMVTGQRPFVADTPFASAYRRLHEPPPSARAVAPELPLAWDSTITRCLARNPHDRFADIR